MIVQENQKQAEQQQEQRGGKKNEAVARDALFVAQWPQAMHAAGGEIIHETRIRGRRAAQMIAQAMPERGQIVFAHAEFVVMIRRLGFVAGLERLMIYFLENRFARRQRWRRVFFGRVRNRCAVRQRGGSKTRRDGRGGRALKLRVEFFDFAFERGELVVQRLCADGNRVNARVFFFGGRHTTSMPQHEGQH